MKQAQKTTDYQQQAIDFLNITGVRLNIEFLRNGKHFEDDTERRDIYKCTLTRGSRSYCFNFGQSLNNSGFYYTRGRTKYPLPLNLLDKKPTNLAAYIKTKIDWDFLNNGKSDVIHYPEAPTSYDILACLTKYDPGTFENFCSDFGYDTDSRKAEKIYHAVKAEYLGLCSIFSEEEIQLLSEIQ